MGMQLTQSMRMHQALHLTPRMIQSMEILQMPLGDLEQRIESEMQSNPILELERGPAMGAGKVRFEKDEGHAKDARSSEEHTLVIKDGGDGVADFKRLDRLAN
jgi:RNA polymerase sigma-54 factor